MNRQNYGEKSLLSNRSSDGYPLRANICRGDSLTHRDPVWLGQETGHNSLWLGRETGHNSLWLGQETGHNSLWPATTQWLIQQGDVPSVDRPLGADVELFRAEQGRPSCQGNRQHGCRWNHDRDGKTIADLGMKLFLGRPVIVLDLDGAPMRANPISLQPEDGNTFNTRPVGIRTQGLSESRLGNAVQLFRGHKEFHQLPSMHGSSQENQQDRGLA